MRLDSATIARTVAQQQVNKVTNQAKEKLQEQIKKQLPNIDSETAGKVLDNLLGN